MCTRVVVGHVQESLTCFENSFSCLCDYYAHFAVIYCCVCVGWRLVSGGGDHDLKIWDMESGHVTNTLSGHKQEVVRVLNKSSNLHAQYYRESVL